MLVGELKNRLNFLENKITDLESYMEDNELESYNDILQELFNLYDTRRSYKILLRRSDENTKVIIGKNEISISDARDLMNTVKAKVDAMNKLIENLPIKLNIFQLMQERDKLIEEYIMLESSIKKSSWETEVD